MSNLKIAYGRVQVFDNILPGPLYRELVTASGRVGWRFGWRAPGSAEARYWHHEVGFGQKANTLDISGNVRKHPIRAFATYMDWLKTHLVPEDTQVLRYYLNAHTYGTDGWPHTDTDRAEELTAVLYLNPEWKPEWGGETVIFNEAEDIEAAIVPRANRLLTFPSNRLHAPRPLSKAFTGMRAVLVIKFASTSGAGAGFTRQSLPGQQEETHLEFLRAAGLDQVEHSGRALADHLVGTYRFLRLRNAEPDICLAGLYHSVYGTSQFRNPAPAEREAIRARIGERAERLAWLFCAVDRPRCWAEKGNIWPLREGGTEQLTPDEIAALRMIEMANLDEQGIFAPKRLPVMI